MIYGLMVIVIATILVSNLNATKLVWGKAILIATCIFIAFYQFGPELLPYLLLAGILTVVIIFLLKTNEQKLLYLFLISYFLSFVLNLLSFSSIASDLALAGILFISLYTVKILL